MNWYTPKRRFKCRPKQKFSLVGAGAHIPAPLYQRCFKDLNNTDPNLQVDYQKIKLVLTIISSFNRCNYKSERFDGFGREL
ncbi:MAG: hypothetical protein AB4080_23155 [Trichodesmium sp.]